MLKDEKINKLNLSFLFKRLKWRTFKHIVIGDVKQIRNQPSQGAIEVLDY